MTLRPLLVVFFLIAKIGFAGLVSVTLLGAEPLDGARLELSYPPDTQATAEEIVAGLEFGREHLGERLKSAGLDAHLTIAGPRLIITLEHATEDDLRTVRWTLATTKQISFHRVIGPFKRGDPEKADDSILLDLVTVATTGETQTESLWIERKAALSPNPVQVARFNRTPEGRYEVLVELTPVASRAFSDVTREIAFDHQGSRRLAIVIDGELYSAPIVSQPLAGGSFVIAGSFDERQSMELTNFLNLPWIAPELLSLSPAAR